MLRRHRSSSRTRRASTPVNNTRDVSSSNGPSERASTPVKAFPTTLRAPDLSRSSGRGRRWSRSYQHGQQRASSQSTARSAERGRTPTGEERHINDWSQLNDSHSGPENDNPKAFPVTLRSQKSSKNRGLHSQAKDGRDTMTAPGSSSRASSVKKSVNSAGVTEDQESSSQASDASARPLAKWDEISRKMRPHSQNGSINLKQQGNLQPTQPSNQQRRLSSQNIAAADNVPVHKRRLANDQRREATSRPASGQQTHHQLRRQPSSSRTPAVDLGGTLKIERRRPSSQASSFAGSSIAHSEPYRSGPRNEHYYPGRSMTNPSQSSSSEMLNSSKDSFSHAYVDESVQTSDDDDDDDDDKATITIPARQSTASLSLGSEVSSSRRTSVPSVAIEDEQDDIFIPMLDGNDRGEESGRSQSRSESRSSSRPTRFAPAPEIMAPVDQLQLPHHRSASPAKSALKKHTNRSSSRASTTGRGSPMLQAPSNEETTSSSAPSWSEGYKRKVSFDASRESPVPDRKSSGTPESSLPGVTMNRLKPVFFPKGRADKRKSWDGDPEYESIFKSRPSLPSFGSIRDRRASMYDSAKSFGTEFQTPSRPTLGEVFANRRTRSSPGSASETPVDAHVARSHDSGTFVRERPGSQSGVSSAQSKEESKTDKDDVPVPDSAALVPSTGASTDPAARDARSQSDSPHGSQGSIVGPEQPPADWDSLYGLGIRFPVGTRERDIAQTPALSSPVPDEKAPSPGAGSPEQDDAVTPEHEYFAFPEELNPGKVRFKRQEETADVPPLRPPKNRSASRSPGPVSNSVRPSSSQRRQFTRRTDGDELLGLRQLTKKPSTPNINLEPVMANSRPASMVRPQEQTPVNFQSSERRPEPVTSVVPYSNPAPEVKKDRKNSGFSLISWGISKTLGLFKRNSKNTSEKKDDNGRVDPSLLDLAPVRGIPRRSTDAESTELEDSSISNEEDDVDQRPRSPERQSENRTENNSASDDKRDQSANVNQPNGHSSGEGNIHSLPAEQQQTPAANHSGTLKRPGGLLASLGFNFGRQTRAPSSAPPMNRNEAATKTKPKNNGTMTLRKKPLPPIPTSSSPAPRVGPRSQSQQSVRRRGGWANWCRDSTPEPNDVPRPATATPTKSASKRGNLLSTLFRRRSTNREPEPEEDFHSSIPDSPPTLHIRFDHSFVDGEDLISRDYTYPQDDLKSDSTSIKRRSLTTFNLPSTSNLHASLDNDQGSLQENEAERPSSVQRHITNNHNHNKNYNYNSDDSEELPNHPPFSMITLFDEPQSTGPSDSTSLPPSGLGIALNPSTQNFHKYQMPLSPIAESPSSPKSSPVGSRRNSNPRFHSPIPVNNGIDKQSLSHEARESRKPSPVSVSNPIDGSIAPAVSATASSDPASDRVDVPKSTKPLTKTSTPERPPSSRGTKKSTAFENALRTFDRPASSRSLRKENSEAKPRVPMSQRTMR